jgi:hypothetical protein
MVQTRSTPFLTDSAPIPLDRPFTRAEARAEGVNDKQLAAWVESGMLVHPLRGVFYAAQLPDGLWLRAQCLALIAPEDAVITDRTAGWFHGASMVLAPNAHLEVPRVSMHLSPGNRLRNKLADSGERTFIRGEVIELHGVRVTSKLRTTCDLGMARSRDQAFAGMGMMSNIADFGLEQLVALATSRRFRGYRYVRQFRSLVPHVRPGGQSPPEYVLLLRWLDCSELPYPRLQVPVPAPQGSYYVDVGCDELRYGAEYFGDEFHALEQVEHDESRLDWLDREQGWTVDVLRKHNVYGPRQDVTERLRMGVARARKRFGARGWPELERRPGSS